MSADILDVCRRVHNCFFPSGPRRLLLAQDPVVSLSLCDRLKPVLGSGGSLLLQLRDGARGVQEVGWFVSEVLSESEADEADRLPREEDFGVDDVLPMAAELVE